MTRAPLDKSLHHFHPQRLWRVGYKENPTACGSVLVAKPGGHHRHLKMGRIFSCIPPWPFRLAFDWTALLFCSYDVMNDIACVEPPCNQHLNLLIISSTVLWLFQDDAKWRRYRDIAYIGTAQKYNTSLQIDILTISYCCPYRSPIFMPHVPRLGAVLLFYPMLIPDYKRIRVYAQARAMHRIKEGASYKDLFHHLVNYIIH